MSIKTTYTTSDDKVFDNFADAENHEASLVDSLEFKLKQYLESYSGKRLFQTHSLDEQGVWKILGEDPNCDFGGHHHQPHLSTVSGTLNQAIQYAIKLDRFYTRGSGGDIVKLDVVVL